MRSAIFSKQHGIEEDLEKAREELVKKIAAELDPELHEEILSDIAELTSEPDLQPDPELLSTLYRPDVPRKELPQGEDEYDVHRISIDGVIVRYVENGDAVLVNVEGKLPSETIDALKTDLLEKLQRLENTTWVLELIS